MLIANPIYDVVFKYMMNDNRVAKLLISAIIGEEILELEFRPTEYKSDAEERTLTVYRIDFAAKIRTGTGAVKTVIIEVQKAKYHTDIMRFRRYLGGQYMSKENSVVDDATGHRRAFPIISIYFIGHALENIKSSIIKVDRYYTDCVTGEIIGEKEEFVECLTHDSYIVQIPALSHKRRNELETILSIFDQSSGDRDNPHTLDVNEDNYPEAYRPVIRALVKAASEPGVRKNMDIEDEVLESIEDLERALHKKEVTISQQGQALHEKDQALHEKDQALHQKDQALHQKEQALHQKDQALHQKEQALHQKDQALHQKEQAVQKALAFMTESGIPLEQAKQKLGLN